ncbi:hypothetical protein PPERSA_02588 [Pseudocohnilembus persalinus]|uniref:Uncharacterized protein n=1 Tax=Pseudocohnilembus persalinus TaxID=266149 RepID=A0A0V0R5E9_PSEPJ|nr:hypothetical protein PPERSA_02588 [Pseudocohnilembus persalinus]|eukprot:KRX09716.1 hypothetical protein PPERSA_02588 [Pseudocohnilembus persalinus]
MKILLVNAYLSGEKSIQFQKLEKQIKQILKESKQLIDISCDVLTVDSRNIDEFIFEPSQPNKNAAQAFNFIDMVIMEGDANLRPWSPRARKPVNVINGVNGGNLKDIKNQVLSLEELKQYDVFLDNVTGDFYRYNQKTREWVPYANTGVHNRKLAQENPFPGKIVMKTDGKKKYNKRLHLFSQILKKCQYLVFRVDTKNKEIVQIFEGQGNETICYVKKIILNHYLFQDVELQFMIPFKNSWDVHKINFPNSNLTFSIMADSKFCPQIIKQGEHIISTQFSISQKYPETIKILKNFIQNGLKIIAEGNQSKDIAVVAYKLLDGSIGDKTQSVLDPLPSVPDPGVNCYNNMTFRQEQPSQELLKSYQEQMYQQYQKDMVINYNSNNNTTYNNKNNNNNTKNKSRLQSGNSKLKLNSFTMFDGNQEFQLNQIGQRGNGQRPITAIQRPQTAQSVKSFTGFMRPQSGKSIGGQFVYNNNFIGSPKRLSLINSSKYLDPSQINNTFQNQTRFHSKKVDSFVKETRVAFGGNFQPHLQDEKEPEQFENEQVDKKLMKTQSEIRQLLHPNISEDGLPQKRTLWIPGQKSSKNLILSSFWKDEGDSKDKVVRVKSVKKNKYFHNTRGLDILEQDKLYVTIQSNQHKNQIRFVPDYDEAREMPSVRTSSKYQSTYEQERSEEKQNKKKNLGQHYFKFGKVQKPKFTGSVITQGEYKHNFLNHQYRDTDNIKWVARKNFQAV